jgi:hypothetical protein
MNIVFYNGNFTSVCEKRFSYFIEKIKPPVTQEKIINYKERIVK